MNNFVKVEGTPFVRDIKSMGLSNVDPVAKEEYLAKQRVLKMQKDDLNKVRDEAASIRGDVVTIKALLQQLLAQKAAE